MEQFGINQPTTEPEKPGVTRLIGRGLWEVSKFFVSVVIMVFVITTFVFQSYEVFGNSMEPTLSQGDKLLISKVERSFARLGDDNYLPERSEIIIFDDPRGRNQRLIKRVVGLPGERVLIQNGIITVFNDENPNGIRPDEELEAELLFTNGFLDETVPEGEVFVVGDNRARGGSSDSRNDIGTVPIENIIGELAIRIYPLDSARLF